MYYNAKLNDMCIKMTGSQWFRVTPHPFSTNLQQWPDHSTPLPSSIVEFGMPRCLASSNAIGSVDVARGGDRVFLHIFICVYSVSSCLSSSNDKAWGVHCQFALPQWIKQDSSAPMKWCKAPNGTFELGRVDKSPVGSALSFQAPIRLLQVSLKKFDGAVRIPQRSVIAAPAVSRTARSSFYQIRVKLWSIGCSSFNILEMLWSQASPSVGQWLSCHRAVLPSNHVFHLSPAHFQWQAH